MDKMYSIKQIAEMVGVTPQSVYAWITSGKLKGIRLTRRILRVTETELKRFIKECSK